MTTNRPVAHRSTKQNLGLLGLVLIALVALVMITQLGESDQVDPTDTRSCHQLREDFLIYSTWISNHDRSASQWEAMDAEKWAIYDQFQAKGCGDIY